MRIGMPRGGISDRMPRLRYLECEIRGVVCLVEVKEIASAQPTLESS
jgi:hypothetical protein